MRRFESVRVYGPAYLDRVVLVDRALTAPGSPPLDQSVDGAWTFGPGLAFHDPTGATLRVEPPPGWPGPSGVVALDRPLGIGDTSVRGLAWHDDLGGMGAGFAAALGGVLVSALGPIDDPMSRAVAARLERAGVRHTPIRVASASADWTLLLTSGPRGDKLPVGFRGCHAALDTLEPALAAAVACDLRVVAAVPNRLAAQALRAPGARLRMFAPSTRNMTDRAVPVAGFSDRIDLLCCNRREWDALADREQAAARVSILAVTDGPAGSVVRFTTPEGAPGQVVLPAFPRRRPPRDTNRAGEAFAATLVEALLTFGWKPGAVEPALVRAAALRASASAALVLDRADFGFPTPREIAEALQAGQVGTRDEEK